MLLKAALVTASVFLGSALFISIAALGNMLMLALLSASIAFIFIIFGIVNTVKARDLRGIVFPVLDILHIGFWIVGAASVMWRRGSDNAFFAEILVANR
jgi:ABC-type thiamin/hydroxymethylpyrimidine transport system permease subunit